MGSSWRVIQRISELLGQLRLAGRAVSLIVRKFKMGVPKAEAGRLEIGLKGGHDISQRRCLGLNGDLDVIEVVLWIGSVGECVHG